MTGKNYRNPTPPVWPDEKNYFQRFNFLAKYYVDPSVVKQMGFVGKITLKARYTFEKNRNTTGRSTISRPIHRRRLTRAA